MPTLRYNLTLMSSLAAHPAPALHDSRTALQSGAADGRAPHARQAATNAAEGVVRCMSCGSTIGGGCLSTNFRVGVVAPPGNRAGLWLSVPSGAPAVADARAFAPAGPVAAAGVVHRLGRRHPGQPTTPAAALEGRAGWRRRCSRRGPCRRRGARPPRSRPRPGACNPPRQLNERRQRGGRRRRPDRRGTRGAAPGAGRAHERGRPLLIPGPR